MRVGMSRGLRASERGPMTATALYLHLPFCRVHCSYCPFAVSTDIRLQERYFSALERELEIRLAGSPRLESIYFGGGTPSRSDAALLEQVVRRIAALASIGAEAEVTIEANPEDVSESFLETCRRAGVTRLSLGVQSLVNDELYPLGRGHSRDTALAALSLAAKSGLRANADLIAGLPRQTVESFETSLREILDHGVGHLSLYMLDLEEGTALERQVSRGAVLLPPDERTTESYLRAIEVAASYGLAQYEISNFAKPGEESAHNLRYWERKPYVGVGMAAHSFDGERRTANARAILDYMERIEAGGSAQDFEERLTDDEVRREKIFLSLRQAAGIERSELTALSGEFGEEWARRGIEEGWLRESENRVAFTATGFLLSNSYISELF
jgi:oxygen-independent coproporphyrinogen-3 oxidase